MTYLRTDAETNAVTLLILLLKSVVALMAWVKSNSTLSSSKAIIKLVHSGQYNASRRDSLFQ